MKVWRICYICVLLFCLCGCKSTSPLQEQEPVTPTTGTWDTLGEIAYLNLSDYECTTRYAFVFPHGDRLFFFQPGTGIIERSGDTDTVLLSDTDMHAVGLVNDTLYYRTGKLESVYTFYGYNLNTQETYFYDLTDVPKADRDNFPYSHILIVDNVLYLEAYEVTAYHADGNKELIAERLTFFSDIRNNHLIYETDCEFVANKELILLDIDSKEKTTICVNPNFFALYEDTLYYTDNDFLFLTEVTEDTTEYDDEQQLYTYDLRTAVTSELPVSGRISDFYEYGEGYLFTLYDGGVYYLDETGHTTLLDETEYQCLQIIDETVYGMTLDHTITRLDTDIIQ